MTAYLIMYSCKNSVKKFKAVDTAVKRYAWDERWMYHFSNTWFIKSEMTADEIGKDLNHVTDENDDFLVIEIKNNYAGWLPQKALDYLENDIFNEDS